jgi:gluconate 5-dehydrogenase
VKALVTGGGSGIGRAMAEALSEAGHEVTVLGRHPATLEATVAALKPPAHHLVADLVDRAQVEAVDVDPDILVNAAGINLRPAMDALSIEDWDRTMAVNLTAPFLLGQRFGPAMARRGFGRIVNLGSQQTIRAFGNSGAYGVSKAAVAALTRSQAEAWSRHGVCCNTIVPSFVHTPMTDALFTDEPDRAEALAARTMIGRNGEPADYRGIIVFLASRDSDFVTGQTIFVDGGFSVT